MSPTKGVRKPKHAPSTDVRVGPYAIPRPAVIGGLLALLYAWALVGGAVSPPQGLIYFLAFALVLLFLRAVQRPYARAIDALLVLAVPPFVWNLVSYGGWNRYFGIPGLLLGAVLAAALLYLEKARPADAFLQAGDLGEGLRTGLLALAGTVVLAGGSAFLSYGAGGKPASAVVPALGALVLLAVLGSLAEELMFRGLLLPRLLPLAGETGALAAQALAFAAYEAAFLYLLSSDPAYAALAFGVAALVGAALAWITLRTKSLLAACLVHAGIYLLLLMPVFAPYFG